jgi:hypothetical protein
MSRPKLSGTDAVDQGKPGAGAAQGVERVDRPLGRGLEDISHLFISRKTSRPTVGESSQENPPAEPSQSGSHFRSILLEPCTPITRDALAAVLRELHGGIEEGLRVIDSYIPCHPYGEIDLLALDRSNQLTIIDFDTTSNDGLLLRGISHFDWTLHNLFNVRRMYAGETINLLAQPRLFLLAPQFSPLLTSVARHIGPPQIEWIRYHVVSASGALGVLFERVGHEGST